MQTDRKVFSVAEAAHYLGIAIPTARLWIAQGRLEHIRLGRRVLVSIESLDRLLLANTVPLQAGRQ